LLRLVTMGTAVVMGPPAHSGTSLPALIAREQRRRRRRLWGTALFAVLIPALLASVWVLVRPKPPPVAARFRFAPVAHGDLVREVRATGHVEAVSSVSVGAEISGRIATVSVDFNDHVKAGQVLATFDTKALEAERARSQALLAAARAQLAQAQSDAAQARRNVTRSTTLLAGHAVTQAEHEAAVTAKAVAEERLNAAVANVAAQAAATSVARTNLDHAVIRAPIDGVIIQRNIDPGQTVASVLQSPVLFTVAANLQAMEVEAAVDEADIGEVAVGQPATFTVNAFPDRVFQGKVIEVRNDAHIVQDVVSYTAVVEVPNEDLALRPGMTASVRVRTATARGVDSVPNAALRFTPPGSKRDEKTQEVFVLERGAPTAVAVSPGLSDGESTALEGGALKVGTPVLVDLTPAGKKAYGLAVPP
jgi:HlyD family secretion protein